MLDGQLFLWGKLPNPLETASPRFGPYVLFFEAAVRFLILFLEEAYLTTVAKIREADPGGLGDGPQGKASDLKTVNCFY